MYTPLSSHSVWFPRRQRLCGWACAVGLAVLFWMAAASSQSPAPLGAERAASVRIEASAPSDEVRKYRFLHAAGGRAVTFDEAVEWLRGEDPALRTALVGALKEVPWAAYFFECPPVNARTAGRQPFEFVAVDAPSLAALREGEPDAFAEHLADRCTQETGVATFYNLGRDAVLVAPCHAAGLNAYPHLAAFVRRGPADQVDALWRAVGDAMAVRVQEVDPRPVWLSTSGLGVYWLHVRMDSRPKYYTFRPFKVWGST